MSRLVFIGGPPAVGKTTVLAGLPRVYERCALLDADDAWRVHPFEVNEKTRAIAEGNVISVLRRYLDADYPFVFLGWVLANPELVARLLAGLEGAYASLDLLYLTASPEVLEARFDARGARIDRTPEEHAFFRKYALHKLGEIEALAHPKIDTSALSTEEVVDRIAEYLG